jgi:hypothetical protein
MSKVQATAVPRPEWAVLPRPGCRGASLSAGESVRWPPDQPHRLWTDASTMTTLTVEHRAK